MNAVSKPVTPDFALARFNMVESQLRPNGVRDERLLDAMATLPREAFVPSLKTGIAYIDEDLEVGAGRYLLKPVALARLLQAAGIKAQDRVLDIGPATGYSTAVISVLAKEVVAIESDVNLGQQAADNLAGLDVKNVEIRQGSLTEGCNDKAPFDVIILNGNVDFVPETLVAQLAEGGRLIAVVMHYGPAHAAHAGEAHLYEKHHGIVSHRALFDANVKSLPGFQLAQKFTF